MRTARLFSLLALAAVGLGCAADPTIPADEDINWYLDVQPILRGNCFHCHGASPQFEGQDPQKLGFSVSRWDICDLEAPEFADILPAFGADSGIKPAKVWVKTFKAGYLVPPGKESGRGSMPPPPADDLTARDKDVVLRWAAQEAPKCGSREGNLRPDVSRVGRPARSGNMLSVTLDVTDGDFDQVLGKVTCGTAEAPIRSSGRVKVTLDVTGVAAGSEALTALVSDGLGRRQRNLGACP